MVAAVGSRSGLSMMLPVRPFHLSGRCRPAVEEPRRPPTGSPTGPTASAATRLGVPVRLRIPAIGVDTGLQRLGLESDGSLQPPSRWGVAGWYAGGPRPGETGPAVIVGHVDSTSGPAVFFRLRELHAG